MVTSSHNGHEGHRPLVSFALGDRDELLYLRYFCEDPTCDWCIVEYGGDDCKEFANVVDELLTHPIYAGKVTADTRGTRRVQTTLDQPDLFS